MGKTNRKGKVFLHNLTDTHALFVELSILIFFSLYFKVKTNDYFVGIFFVEFPFELNITQCLSSACVSGSWG